MTVIGFQNNQKVPHVNSGMFDNGALCISESTNICNLENTILI